MTDHVSARFPTRVVADMVCTELRKFVRGISCRVSFEDNLSDSDRRRGVGSWAIVFEAAFTPGSTDTSRMFSAVDFAMRLVLADELAKVSPQHPLLQTWYLNKENRENVGKYDFSDIARGRL